MMRRFDGRRSRARGVAARAFVVLTAAAMTGIGVYVATDRILVPHVLPWAASGASNGLIRQLVNWASSTPPIGFAITSFLAVTGWGGRWIWRAQRAHSHGNDAQDVLADTVAQLAKRLLVQYREQEWRHGVSRSMPLRVRFSSSRRPAAARSAVLATDRSVHDDDASDRDWQEFPLEGDVTEIVQVFRGLPHRHLVVLGEPGAGKSVLALLLARRLLSESLVREPVPVLLPMSSWDPRTESVAAFVACHLRSDYGYLDGTGGHSRVFHRLVNEPQLESGVQPRYWTLPILDGLDEIPDGRRAQAIVALNRFAAGGHPLVVTCRSHEYQIMAASSRKVLSFAAVVEIQPVKLEAAIEYLSHPAPDRPLWTPVFDHLRDNPNGLLARTLTTPLQVAMARVAYSLPGSDPAELVGLSSRRAITATLIDRYLQAAYDRVDPQLVAASDGYLRVYPPGRAERWLGCLAYVLYTAGTRDLRWRRIPLATLSAHPRWTMTCWSGAVVAVLALLVGTGTALLVGPPAGVFTGLGTAAIASVTATDWFGRLWANDRHGSSTRMIWRAALVGPAVTGWAWVRFRLAHLRLAVHGWLPVRLGPFIRDAYARGVLRLNGSTWQFRHALIQDRVAEPTREHALRSWATAGDAAAAHSLFDLLRHQGRIDEALVALRHQVAIDPSDGRQVAFWLNEFGRRDEAIQLMRRQMDAGHPDAFQELIALLAKGDDFDEAMIVARQAETAGLPEASEALTWLLTKQAAIDELRLRAEAGDLEAANAVLHILKDRHLLTEAEAFARRIHDLHGRDDTMDLVSLMLLRGDRSGAIAALQELPADNGYASWQLHELLVEDDDFAGLRRSADRGNEYAAFTVFSRLRDQGEIDEAIEVLRPFAEANKTAAVEVSKLLEQQGRLDDAASAVRRGADAGDHSCARRLAELLRMRGDIDELRHRSDLGDDIAALELADHLRDQGELDAAMTVLVRSAEAGNSTAAERRADLLRHQGGLDKLRARAAAGDVFAAMSLADALCEHGEIDEAVAVLRPFADEFYIHARLKLGDILFRIDPQAELDSSYRRSPDGLDPAPAAPPVFRPPKQRRSIRDWFRRPNRSH